MSLLSFFRKNKQETAPDEGEFYSRAEDDANVARARGKRKSKQASEPVDPILPEKKRARRRLVGAIALVLAAIIGLPMILDSEPKPLAEDISIQIPSKDQPRRQRAPVAAVDTLDQTEQIVEPEAAAATVQAPLATAENGQGNLAKTPDASTQVPEKPPIKVEARAEPKPASPEPKAAVADARDDARARAILEGRVEAKATPAKPPADAKSGKYMVQVAALASQEKINELRNKLKAAGIQSQVQKVATASGERTRIRVGPFASKEEADKMRARLTKLDLNGTLVPLGH